MMHAEGDNKADSVKSSPRLLGRPFTQPKSIGQQVGGLTFSHAGAVNGIKFTDCSGYVPLPSSTARNIPSPLCFLV